MRSSMRIVGPLAIIVLAILGYFLYVQPLKSILWTYQTRLSWAGVVQHQADLKASHIAWYEAGYKGEEALLLVHGFGAEGSLEWRGNMGPIAEGHFRVIAVDLPGFGDSTAPPAPLTIDSEARALWELLDGLKIDNANLVGRDIGADVVLQMAVDFPERAQRIGLISGGLFGKDGLAREQNAFVLKDPGQTAQFASLTLVGLPSLPGFFYNHMYGDFASSQQATQQLLADAPNAEKAITAGLGKIFNTLKVIVWGKDDPIQPLAEADRLHAALAGSAIASIDNTGHAPNAEHPDEFNDVIYTILKQ